VQTDHTNLQCITTVPGVGADIKWIITVASQSNNPLFQSTVAYTAPTLTSISGPATIEKTATEGQIAITLTGTNFGPKSHTDFVVHYGPESEVAFVAKYTAGSCTVDTQETITCETVAGVGSDLKWRVTIGDQLTQVSSNGISYVLPLLLSIAGAAVESATTTDGGVAITLTGSNFGVDHLDSTYVADDLVVHYGPDGSPDKYAASNCKVTTSQTEITCTTSSGLGIGLKWRVSLASQISSVLDTTTTAYMKPSITGFVDGNFIWTQRGAEEPSTADGSTDRADTIGGDWLSLLGNNFGPNNPYLTANEVSATYGPAGGSTSKYTATNCLAQEITVASVVSMAITCKYAAGVGANLEWVITVGGQLSEASTDIVRYKTPVINSISGNAVDSASSTIGGGSVTLTGTYFGRSSDGAPVVHYGPSGSPDKYLAVGCSLASAQTTITCTKQPGVGVNLFWRITVGDQPSDVFVDTATSYSKPVIESFSGVGASDASTRGGDEVTIDGSHFGPQSYMTWTVTIPSEELATTAADTSVTQIGTNGVGTLAVALDGSATTTITIRSAIGQVFDSAADLVIGGGSGFTVEQGKLDSVTSVSHTEVSATYGPDGNTDKYDATDCVVLSHTQITCNTEPGVGGNLKWVVIIGGQESVPSTAFTNYISPTLIAMSGDAVNGPTATTGDAAITLTGDNFGPNGSENVVVTYGPEGSPTKYNARSCVVASQNTITCTTTAGVGINLKWQVSISLQTSIDGPNDGSTTSYVAPEIEGIVGGSSPTDGGATITLTGTSFGPIGNNDTSARYGPSSNPTKYLVGQCVVIGQTEMACVTIPGIGIDHQWSVIVGTQVSTPEYTTTKTSYMAPAISSGTLDVGKSTLDTVGNQNVWLNGTNFGTVSEGATAISATFGVGGTGFTVPSANCVVTVDHVQILCTTVPLYGSSLQWKVVVGGQLSNLGGFTYQASIPVLSGDDSAGGVVDVNGNELIMQTTGNLDVYLEGSNFGTITVVGDDQVVVKYGNSVDGVLQNPLYTATDCAVIEDHVKIKCTYKEGVGKDLSWTVERSSRLSLSSVWVTRYHAPAISSVIPAVNPVPGNTPTAITLTGTNFGPTSTPVSSSYFQFGGLHTKLFFGSSLCGTNDGTEWCTATDGTYSFNPDPAVPQAIFHTVNPSASSVFAIWSGYSITNDVYAIQFSGVFKASKTVLQNGDNPQYTFSALPAATSLRKSSIRIHIDGQSMVSGLDDGGSTGEYTMSLSPGLHNVLIEFLSMSSLRKDNDPGIKILVDNVEVPADRWGRRVDASSCSVTVAHSEIQCNTATVPGTGLNWAWNVELGSQTSVVSTATVGFSLPEFQSVSSISDLNTAGGEVITIDGTGFGETKLVLSGTYGRVGLPNQGAGTGYTFQKCQVTDGNAGRVECQSQEGAGDDLLVLLIVDGVSSPVDSSYTVGYASPTITQLIPPVGPASGGYDVVILGDNFGPLGSAAVTVGGTNAVLSSPHNHTHIVVTIPESSTGTQANLIATVLAQASTSTPSLFYYYKALDFSPHFGWWGGYTTITVTGEGFVDLAGVNCFARIETAGSTLVPITYVNPTTITFVTPSLNQKSGTFQPLLSMNNGVLFQAVNEDRKIVFYDTPKILDIAVKSGPITGSTSVEIRGIFFETGSYTIKIIEHKDFTVGMDIDCTLKTDTSDILVCVTPVWSLLSESQEFALYSVKLSVDTNDAILPDMNSDTTFRDKVVSSLGPYFEESKSSYPSSCRLRETTLHCDWFTSGGKLYVGNPDVDYFQYYKTPAVTLLSPPLGPTQTSGLGLTIVNITGTNLIKTTDITKIQVSTESTDALNVICKNDKNCIIQTLVPQQTTAQSVAIEVALNGQQFTSSGVSFEFYTPAEVYVHLRQQVSLTLFDFSTVNNDQIKLVSAVAATLSVDASTVTIISVLDLEHSGRRRRLQGTNEGIIVDYAVEVPKSTSVAVKTQMNDVLTNDLRTNLATEYSSLSLTASEIVANIVAPVIPVLIKNVPSPIFGPMRGGTVIDIKGRGFVDSSHGAFARCRFDTEPAQFVQATFVSGTQMKCTTPSSLTSGFVNVSLSMNGQNFNDDRMFLFEYYTPPVIERLSEVYMPLLTQNIYIHGYFFDTGVSKVVYDVDVKATLCDFCVNGTTPNVAVRSPMYCANCTEGGAASRCGDLVCDAVDGKETCITCPDDCGTCTAASCGDHRCEALSETCSSCPLDCGMCDELASCPNTRCDIGESCSSCPADCGKCTDLANTCGDGICNQLFESCASCPLDCADGICSASDGEDCESCPADCDNCWPSQDQYTFDCIYMNASVLHCPVPPATNRQSFHARVYIDTSHDTPVELTSFVSDSSVSFYEPYNVTVVTPQASPWSGETIFDVIGEGFGFYARNRDQGACKMGTKMAVAHPHTWYQDVHVSNLGSTSLNGHQVLLEINTLAMILSGQLREDCEDIEIRSANGDVISSDQMPVWLDRSSCNQTETFLWVRIPFIASGDSLHLRLVFGSGVAKVIRSNNDAQLVFETFDAFETVNTVLFQHSPNVPNNYSDGSLEFFATLPALAATHASKRITTRFAESLERPFVVEASGTVNDCTSHLMYVSGTKMSTPESSSFSIDWRCDEKHVSGVEVEAEYMAPCIASIKGEISQTRRMTLAVSDNGINATAKAMDNRCAPVQVSHISPRARDFVYFGSADSHTTSKYEWIAVRKYAEIEPTVQIGGVKRGITEFICSFPIASVADEKGDGTSNNLTLFQAEGNTWVDTKTKRSIFVKRYEEVTISSIVPSNVKVDTNATVNLDFDDDTHVGDMLVSVGEPSNTMISCNIPKGTRTGNCVPPHYGVDTGFPPQLSVPIPLLVSSNRQQFVTSTETLTYDSVGTCAVIAQDSFEDALPNFQFGFSDISKHGSKSATCAGFAGQRALVFKSTNEGMRYVQTLPFDARCGMNIEFYLKIGTYGQCTISKTDQFVQLEFSTDDGATWFNMVANFIDRDYSDWTLVKPSLPKESRTRRTILRWSSDPASTDATPLSHIIWALDLVQIDARMCSSAEELIFAGSEVSPRSGPATGGTSVTIKGDFERALGQAVQCTFGDAVAADIINVTATSITCITPEQSLEGEVSISLSICGSVPTISVTKFHVYKTPVIQVYSPSSISTAGGRVRFVLQSDFAWFQTDEAVVDLLHTESGFSARSSAELLAVDELLAEQPKGSSYRDVGFPWSSSAETVRFQAVYTWDQLIGGGLSAGDVVTSFHVLPAQCPSIDVSQFRLSVLAREGDPTDGLPVNFADGLYMNGDPPETVFGPSSMLSTECTPNEWMTITLDKSFTIENNKALLIEFSETNALADLTTGKDIPLGLTMRHTFSSQTVRWDGAAAAGVWPYVGQTLEIADNLKRDQRLPCLKICRANGCPTIVTVTANMVDIANMIASDVSMDGFQVGIALNGQQNEIFPLTVFRPMFNILSISPPLGPSAGSTSIRIIPGDFTSGDTSVVAIFTKGGIPSGGSTGRRRLADISVEVGVAKYYTACE
jgi:hypothetical protein